MDVPPHDDGHPPRSKASRARARPENPEALSPPRTAQLESDRPAPPPPSTLPTETIPGTGPSPEDLLHHRLAAVLQVAAFHNTALSVEEIATLLPESGPATEGEVVAWIESHPASGKLQGGHVTPVEMHEPSPSTIGERRVRGVAYWEAACALVRGPMAPTLPLVECLGVTGSAAYQEPVDGDDIDLMAITKPGMAWIFLLFAFARLRFLRRGGTPSGSRWCLNYVVDGARAEREYLRPQGFLFAREALTARIIRGGQYYHSLLSRARWMQEELPRYYRKRLLQPATPDPASRPVGVVTRLANLAVFPLLATYLQMVGLLRNHRLMRSGRYEERFRTETRLDRFELRTAKFEGLREVYTSPVLTGARESPA